MKPNANFIILAMLFMHVFDDYFLQGILAQMKQKDWWLNLKEYKPMYNNDYIVALLCHSISWAFCVMLPIAWYYSFNIPFYFITTFVFNVAVHMMVDDLKANKHTINLVTDQSVHGVQLLITYAFLMM